MTQPHGLSPIHTDSVYFSTRASVSLRGVNMQQQERPPALTVTTVARQFDVSVVTVRRYIARGLLQAYRLPGGYRIPSSEVDRLTQASGSNDASHR